MALEAGRAGAGAGDIDPDWQLTRPSSGQISATVRL